MIDAHKFDMQGNGSVSWNIPGIPTGITYHVTLTCLGPYQGETIEFGHVDRTEKF